MSTVDGIGRDRYRFAVHRLPMRLSDGDLIFTPCSVLVVVGDPTPGAPRVGHPDGCALVKLRDERGRVSLAVWEPLRRIAKTFGAAEQALYDKWRSR